MLEWLFRAGGFHICWSPLICSGLIGPWAAAWLMGASIRRTGEGPALSGGQKALRWGTHGLASLTLSLLYFPLLSGVALQPATPDGPALDTPLWTVIIGSDEGLNRPVLLICGVAWLMALLGLNLSLQEGLRQGGFIREQVDRWRVPAVERGALGSSHFCTMREFGRYRRPDPDGMALYGAFWGAEQRRLDWDAGVLHLSGEDLARGLLTLGTAGSGKTQGVILPAIADRMRAGHSLIVADPQGELTHTICPLAAVTGHVVVIHDPTSPTGPRYNLAADIHNVSDARAIADVLVPHAEGDNRFWSDSAAALLAACLIRFPHLGAIYNAMNDVKALAEALGQGGDDAALLANAFIASVKSDGKVAANVVATLATALTGWASTDVRANTAACDFDAGLIVGQATVVVLRCPGRMRAVYAPYLGATLRKLMMDLDTIGEENGGPLPVPVGVILDEFPTLGKLDSLVADVNLVRKRRISILIGAQTKGQFHLIYGREGTQALFTGLATQIVYGGCDAETAEFYSKAAGTSTSSANTDDPQQYLRQRPLLTVDEVLTPQRGNCTVFARYVLPGFATQVIFNARLTRFYERRDWQRWLATEREPLLLERGVDMQVTDESSSEFDNTHAVAQLCQVAAPQVQMTSLTAMRALLGQGEAS